MTYRGVEVLLDEGLTISGEALRFPRNIRYGVNEDLIRHFILSYLKLMCDSPLKTDHGSKPRHLVYAFIKRLTGEHVLSTIKTFSGYADEILRNQYVTGTEASTGYFLDAMKTTPIFKEYLEWYRTRRPELLQFILSFLYFGKKLEYDDPQLNATAFRGWLQVEEKLRTLTFEYADVRTLRNIISVLVPALVPDDFWPRFGPGAVADIEGATVWDKLSQLSQHPRLEYAFGRARRYGDADRGIGPSNMVSDTQLRSRSSSRLKFVPKNIKTSRSICMEPNAFMFHQQEVLRWMRTAMADGQIHRYCDMDDQTRSQDAAIHGSKYLSTDTIDLSAASDSVSLELVRRIFPASWLYWMMATRTSEVEAPDGRVYHVAKFAPMGSAICFPTQCIIFTACAIYAGMEFSYGKLDAGRSYSPEECLAFMKDRYFYARSEATPFRDRFEPPVIYGDDISCDTRHTDHLIAILERLGFTVNVDKSFTGCQSFRESCGVFAFEGSVVTPVLYRLPLFRKGKWDAKIYSAIISQINRVREAGLHQLAAFYLATAKSYHFRYALPFTTSKDAFGIYTLNKHKVPETRLRWDPDYQVHYEEVQGIKAVTPKGKLPSNLEEYRYNLWWRNRIRNSEPPAYLGRRGKLRIRPQETRLAAVLSRCE